MWCISAGDEGRGGTHRDQKRALESPGAGVIGSRESFSVCMLGTTLTPLQEQNVLSHLSSPLKYTS